ncbi:MAG TPA: glycoside hydrolase family 2 TIM barrel-domain containing protein, partial [Candidatus Methylacidiphilales bacterium]
MASNDNGADGPKDIFARIGQEAPATGGSKLVKRVPTKVSEVRFASGPYQPSDDFQPLSRVASHDEFARGLGELREQMRPFLGNHAPKLELARPRLRVDYADWRLESDAPDFDRAMAGEGQWTQVRLPHYGGPMGKAAAWYRREIELTPEMFSLGSIFLCFRGADYQAQVYLNGRFLGQHEGFFEPFEMDATPAARVGANVLLVQLENDLVCNGNLPWNMPGDGDKIYAAIGLGWDEPGLGWHHCPPGMGLYQDVYFEARPPVHLADVWVRPLPEEGRADIHAQVRNGGPRHAAVRLSITIVGRNFETVVHERLDAGQLADAGGGLSEYCVTVDMPEFRWWHPDRPWLYEAQVSLSEPGHAAHDSLATAFGMRSFVISENRKEKGRLYLNGQEVRLRGANTMGHEQQAVFCGDLDQLRDDILIAKYAGLNFLRLTQRPVQSEVYAMCDQLGMMVQTDLPLFGKLRRTQFAEGVRQAGSMERLVRRHPCCVMASLINEPFPDFWSPSVHRHLRRSELELFFRACIEIIRYENPDRQIKPADGDYHPPSPGLPDNHCYAGWYAGHGLDLGKLHRGHWVAVKPGWFYACGEFGAEGLDPVDLMRRRYPASWLPEPRREAVWTPLQIKHAQTGRMYGLWMEASDTMENWVARSQAHQASSVRMMTRAFRRDNRMVSFALHLLIDAFPAGWMKAVVDCERRPKPAYFAYRDALRPLLVDVRFDRRTW